MTSRAMQIGDILSLNTFPMISGYAHDILIITEDGHEDITHYPHGPGFYVVG